MRSSVLFIAVSATLRSVMSRTGCRFFSSRRRHMRLQGDWSSDVCSSDLPCLILVSGPRPVAIFQGRRIGTGTDLWRLWDERRPGELSDEAWSGLESALTLRKGTCNTMGTASSMGAICEALGLAWPGSTSIPAGDPRHLSIAHNVGQRIVSLVTFGTTVSSHVT